MKDLHRILINAALFNVGWFGCVLSSRWGEPLVAVPIVGGILAVHLAVVTPRHTRASEALAIAGVAAIGTLFDTLNFLFGILGFAWSAGVFVPWIACFWINFACTLNTSLRWLARMPIVAGVLAVISAPGTYFFGAKLGALTLHETAWIALAVLAIQWAVMLPAMSLLARRITRRSGPGAAPGTHRGSSAVAASGPAGRPAS